MLEYVDLDTWELRLSSFLSLSGFGHLCVNLSEVLIPGKRFVRPESTEDVDAEVRLLEVLCVVRVDCFREWAGLQVDLEVRDIAEVVLSTNGKAKLLIVSTGEETRSPNQDVPDAKESCDLLR